MDAGMLFNGLQYKWSVETLPGTTAARDRRADGSYRIELNLKVKVPHAALTVEEVSLDNPALPTVLSSLPTLLETAKVSPAYQRLYDRKLEWLRSRLERIEQILSRHNYYDCDTILELRHPETGRKVLLVQGDMDVNVDGSDGDRNIEVDGSNQFFQPQTSYRWPKTTKRPNPFIARFEEKISAATKELADPVITAARRTELREQIADAKRQIADLKSASFLVSKTDPSIVLPGFMMGEGGPKVGDYAVVIHKDKMYPAILGDAGPSYKVGEASLRLCDEINPTSTPLARPISNLGVTYLIFPGSAEAKRSAPDLDLWYERCKSLLAEIGAPEAPLHRWENLVPPWPTPTPTPTPSPTPSPTPTPASEATPTVNLGTPSESPSPVPTASPGEAAPSPSPPPAPASTPEPSPTASPTPHASPALR